MKNFLVSVLFFAASQMAFGQSNTNLAKAPKENSSSSSILKHVIAGMKSQNSSGRAADLNDEHGRQIQAQQEVWLGYKHESGFGLYGLYAATFSDYKNSDKTKWTVGDPSITLVHPAWYSGSDLRITGKLRRYFPASDYSKTHDMRQTAYYIDTSYKMPYGQEIYNNTTLRAFTYSNHGPSATKFYVEDMTNYTKSFAKNWRWGIGHWTQYEEHYNTPTGLSVEISPMLDYVISPKTFMGPRIRFPIVAENAVFDGPKAAKWNQAYFQFFLLMNL